jgi:hypothetical protein
MPNVPQAQKSFCTPSMELLGDVGLVQSCFGPFVNSVSVSEDRCTVCARRTIGSKSLWTHPMILHGDEAHVEARFSSFGDSGNLDVR